MKTSRIYEKFVLKLDAVGTNSIAVDKGTFCLIFNEAMNRLIEYFIANKTDDNIRYVQKILTTEEIESSSKKYLLYQDFKLPSNFFDFSSVKAIATSGFCKSVIMDLYEIKNQNKDVILGDEYNKPSFLYREAPFYIGDNNINVYVDESFYIDKIILDYYRYPIQIKLLNEDYFESDFDDSVEVEFDDKFIDRVISLAVSQEQISIKDEIFGVNNQKALTKN